MAEASQQFTHDDYTVGWICALPLIELVAAGAMLDAEHPVLSAADSKDTNCYLFGSIGGHNVVIACLPAQETGKVNAATVAKDMLRSFKAVRFGLMVGIGGGAPWYGDGDEYESDDSASKDPEETKDIRLGDVVIGLHSKSTEAVEQYDFGKSMQDKGFVSAGGRLNKPPQIVLNAVSMLQGQHKRKGNNISKLVSGVLLKGPGMAKEFACPGMKKDRLFKADILHIEGKKSCKACCGPLDSNLVDRKERNGIAPKVHYGTIGSADQVMKDAVLRDKLAREKDIICFEMEAAGLMDSFPCLVIRGICDYADSHKNKIWQPYAALTAAAYAKELLSVIPATEINKLPLIEVVEQINKSLERVQQISHNTNAHVLAIKTNSHTARITGWLSPADPSTNINNARQSRHEGTGTWFLQSQSFADWKNGSYQSLWIYGIPGCGKSVLSATILDHLAEMDDGSTLTLAFFFDFRDEKKKNFNDILCFFASQIYYLRPASRQPLDGLFASHQDGRQHPNADSLSRCLAEMLNKVEKVVVLVDALDECSERRRLLKWMKYFFPAQPHVRLLCTSRLEDDIQHSMSGWMSTRVPLDEYSVNADIQSYIKARLYASEEFSRWLEQPAVLEEIEDTLGSKADRMFRWAACQLDRLAECRDRQAVRDTLQSLPANLNETYARILENIPTERKGKTIRLIQFLVYSSRPLALEEAVDVVAVCVSEKKGSFDRDDRLPRPDEITSYCSSLVSVVKDSKKANSCSIQLAHFSVKEYFEKCSEVAFIKPKPMAVITQICLAYLGSIPTDRIPRLISDYPLARYAAEVWITCAQHAEVLPAILQQIVDFFLNKEKFRLWASLYNPERPWDNNPGRPNAGPLYFACHSGLTETVLTLISQKVDINAQGGRYGNALQAASLGGHLEIVQLLLDNGADINMQSGEYGNALQAASLSGHLETIQLLLDNGADVNAQGGEYDNALQAASYGGHVETVQRFLDNGADINAQGGRFGNALQAASLGGHLEIVQRLLDNGADINARGSGFCNALQAASLSGHLEIVQRLLGNGADVNAQGGLYGNTLQAASLRGHLETIQLLLDNGADVNAEGGEYGNALQAASLGGHLETIQLLLDNRANINAQGGDHGNALQAASYGGHVETVQLLLDNGADINAQGGRFGNALQAASLGGHLEIVQRLLDNGADINAQGGDFGNALHAASLGGHLETIQQLLDNGADINTQGGRFGNALQAASLRGHLEIVQLLLDNGADVNAQGGHYGNTLQAASYGGHVETVQLLLDNGADINVQGGDHGNALQAASYGGHVETVQRLLDNGADVNAQGGDHGNALQAASLRGHLEIIQRLLDNGADVNAEGGYYGNALQAASLRGYLEIVQRFLENGADVNAQGGYFGNALQAASLKGHPETVQLLLDNGAISNVVTKSHAVL